ncbi:MAG: hypothetical protein M3Z31_08840 [Pseudomonadota bacterium]|nr:hypothetical protein [Pseudomonadota bacterium]
MRLPKLLVTAALLVVLPVTAAQADKKTVCTITVNSADEKDIFRRYLPEGDYDFVELVERGRPDWLESACRQGVRCDVLLISGHFDDGTQFYSDRPGAREYLPVDEMERAACSESCPGVFNQLKEVYLFGCNTLNADVLRSTSSEVTRSLRRAGYSASDAERVARLLDQQHGDSNRDRMRQIFSGVPVIYGFSSKAPLGGVAASVLERYFQSAGTGEIASGQPSTKLLSLFAPVSMTVAPGLADGEAQGPYRRDVCEFADDRPTVAKKLSFIRSLLHRDVTEVRMFLERIEKQVMALTTANRERTDVQVELAAIAQDTLARERFLDFSRDVDQASTRARMIELAHELGWLTVGEKRAELRHMLADQVARHAVGPAEIDLACSLDTRHGLGSEIAALPKLELTATVAHAAVLACLRSPEARQRVLQALSSKDQADVELAQVYLQHRPVTEVPELRALATAVTRMNGSDSQVRALEALARLQVSDPDTLHELARLFPNAKSVSVQRAIAGVLIRADHSVLARPELVRTLREHRLKSTQGPDVIDVLIRRLQS